MSNLVTPSSCNAITIITKTREITPKEIVVNEYFSADDFGCITTVWTKTPVQTFLVIDNNPPDLKQPGHHYSMCLWIPTSSDIYDWSDEIKIYDYDPNVTYQVTYDGGKHSPCKIQMTAYHPEISQFKVFTLCFKVLKGHGEDIVTGARIRTIVCDIESLSLPQKEKKMARHKLAQSMRPTRLGSSINS